MEHLESRCGTFGLRGMCYGCCWFQGQVQRYHAGCHFECFQPLGQQFLDCRFYFTENLMNNADYLSSSMNTIPTRISPSTISSRFSQSLVDSSSWSTAAQVNIVSTRRRRSTRCKISLVGIEGTKRGEEESLGSKDKRNPATVYGIMGKALKSEKFRLFTATHWLRLGGFVASSSFRM